MYLSFFLLFLVIATQTNLTDRQEDKKREKKKKQIEPNINQITDTRKGYLQTTNQMDFIISYLKENNYEILSPKISTKEEGDGSFNKQFNAAFEGFSKQFIGLSLNTNQKVSIKISKSERIAYEMVKYEHSILLKMMHFDSVVHLIESFDLESENLFILITEYYDKSLDKYIQELVEENITLSIKEIANLFDTIFYSLNQLHYRGISHNHINPYSIAIDEEGNFRFHSFISSTHLDHYYEYCKTNPIDKQLLIYKAPDYESNQINFKEESFIRKLLVSFSEDIFSLGVILLQLIGVQVNESVLKEILTKNYLELTHLVIPEFFNILAFIKSFLLLKEERQRKFEVRYLRRQFQSCYRKFMDRNEDYEANLNLILYIKYNIPHDFYYFVLKIQLLEAKNKAQQINELISLYENQPIQERQSYGMIYFYKEISEQFYSIGDYQKCLEYLLISTDITKTFIKEDIYEFTASLLKYTGFVYYYSKIYDKALDCFQQAYEIYKKLYGSVHIKMSSSLADLADCYNKMNNRQTAIEKNLEAIEMANKVFIGEHYFKIDMLNSMGYLYREDNQHKQSLNMYLQVLKTKDDVFGADRLKIAVALKEVGICYSDLRQFDQAIEYHKKSLKLREQLSKQAQPHTANSLSQLAYCYFASKDYTTGFYYSYRYHEMNLKLNKNNFENEDFRVLLRCIEGTLSPHIRLEFYLRFFKLLITNLNKNNRLIKQFLVRITQLFNIVKDYEAEEQFENMKILLSNQG